MMRCRGSYSYTEKHLRHGNYGKASASPAKSCRTIRADTMDYIETIVR